MEKAAGTLMPRPRNPWFRFYTETLYSRKVMTLKPPLFRWWVLLLCQANVGSPRGTLPPTEELAYALHVKESQVEPILKELCEAGLLDAKGGWYVAHNWEGWQSKRDVSPGMRDESTHVNHGNGDLNHANGDFNRAGSSPRSRSRSEEEGEEEEDRAPPRQKSKSLRFAG